MQQLHISTWQTYRPTDIVVPASCTYSMSDQSRAMNLALGSCCNIRCNVPMSLCLVFYLCVSCVLCSQSANWQPNWIWPNAFGLKNLNAVCRLADWLLAAASNATCHMLHISHINHLFVCCFAAVVVEDFVKIESVFGITIK